MDELTLEDLDAIALNSVQVTFDGPRDVHSSRRPLRTGPEGTPTTELLLTSDGLLQQDTDACH
jgi:sulfatase maturation enzyme AslB (radical SAM superfamily)